MATPYAILLDSIPDTIGIVMICASFYYVRRQKLSQFVDVRRLLLLVDSFFAGVLILDLLDRLYTATEFAIIDSLFQSILILSDVAFLTAISYIIYVRPREKTFKDRVKALVTSRLWPHGILLFSYMGILLFAILYLVFDTPYTVVNLSTLGGVQVTTLEYNHSAVIISAVIVAVFIAYPSVETFLAARQVRNRLVGRAIQVLGLSWVVIGAELFTFNGYLINQGINLTEIGYLISAVSFSVSVGVFRRASILEEFLGGIKKQSAQVHSINPFSNRIVTLANTVDGKRTSEGAGHSVSSSNLLQESRSILLELNPSVSYEELVMDLALESTSKGRAVFAFTPNGSPIHKRLTAVPDVKLYVISSNVSYPKASDQPNTILVPQYDMAITLNILDKIANNSNPEMKTTVVFDNLSDLILLTGFENSYRFLKKAIEVMNVSSVTSVFLLIAGAQELRTLSIIKSMFSTQLAFDSTGLKMNKW